MAETFHENLSAQDAAFLGFETSTTPMHVGGQSIHEAGRLARPGGGVDFTRIRAYIASRLHLIPRYRQRLDYTPLDGHPLWIDDDRFDLDDHVRHIGLPAPGSDRELRELTAHLMSVPLDLTRPLWEVWVIEGLAGGRFAVLTKVHHSVIDGQSGVDLLQVLLTPTPDDDVPAAQPWTPRPAPGRLELLGHEVARRVGLWADLATGIAAALRAPRAFLGSARETLGSIWDFGRTAIPGAPPTPLNGPIGARRRVEWMTTDLVEVKAVKDALGGTVNDVVLATVSGALHRYLTRRDMDVDGLGFRAIVPVSRRSEAERGTLGNRVSAWISRLPIDEAEPRARYERVRAMTGILKDTKQAAAADALSGLGTWFGFRALCAGLWVANLIQPYNLIVTNVRGPDFPLYFCGARMVACYPLLPLFENQGMGIALFSYLGRIHWGVVGDRALMPDLSEFVTALEASFTDLRRAAGVRPAHRAPRATPRPTHERPLEMAVG
jgi:WS/DGAT/MGAT family acyltransferase